MQRDMYDTVTQLPILIPATPGKEEGFVVFQSSGKARPVRVLCNEDLKGASRSMKPHEAQHFYAVVMLGKALGAKPDPLAYENAMELMAKAKEMKMKSHVGQEWPENLDDLPPLHWCPAEDVRDFARADTVLSAIPPWDTAKVLPLHKPSPLPDLRWLLSCELSEALQEARLVLWWSGKVFKAAVFCPSLKIAFYTAALLKMLRVCPHCSEPFIPERPDQDYCSVPHREAHRVARWRLQQKRKATGKKEKNVTRKTR
jgi:hypothetical protein